MTGREHVLAYKRWRAPQSNGAALFDPPLVDVPRVLDQNRALLPHSYRDCFGESFVQLASRARSELLQLARQYTSQYRNVPDAASPDDASPILLAGHQPHLFHAGVWFKTFVLSSLGKRLGAHAINLLIDNDTLRTPSIRVPGGSLAAPQVESVPFDRPAEEIPYEEREILDRECFDSFGARAASLISPLVPKPLVRELWPLVSQATRRSRNLGGALAEGRHCLEASWGLATLEVPMSVLCETESFCCFAAGLLVGLPRLHKVYNTSLAEYRRVNRIRSRSHPVPELAEEHGFLEAPFWLWTRANPRRRRLFVYRHADRLELTDRDRVRFDLPLGDEPTFESATTRLFELSSAGIRLRPRALLTTMYARLLLGDLFLHGIGGAKYDQLTDALMARYFGVSPRAFLTVTATLRLPLERAPFTRDDLRRLGNALRELRFHPERFVVDPPEEAQRMIAEKERWLSTALPGGQRSARHRGIESMNLALQPYVEDHRRSVVGELSEVESRRRAAALLGSREFSFCLFPGDYLEETLKRLAQE